MKRFWSLMQYVSAYRYQVWMTILSHSLSALFTVVSLPLIIPFFQILFDVQETVVEQPTSAMDIDGHLKYYFANILNTYDKQDALLIVCLAIIVVFFFKNLFRYLASYFITPVRNSLVADIRKGLFKKYLSLPMSFFTDEKKGNLIARMSNDVTEIEHSILNVLEGAIKAPFIMIGCLAFMIYVSPHLTLFVFGLLFVVVFVIGSISRTLRKHSGEAQESVSRIISHLEESIGGMKVIKAFQGEKFQLDRFNKENIYYRDKLTSILRRRDLSSPMSEFLGVSVVAVLLYYGSRLVFSDALNPGTFFAFIFAFYSIIEPSKLIANAYYNVQKGMASVDRIQQIQDINNDISDIQGSAKLGELKNGIDFKEVSFRYPGSETDVLSDISLKIPANKVTALVGLSGAGKTSLVDLIPRFYDITDGTILLDKKAIQEYSIESLRKSIGLVTQEPILFNDTIKNNVIFGMSDVSEQDLENALQAAHAASFIKESENGLDTIIGDRGVKLSGGQRQRITLARAILQNAPILILDEATSALDAESEKLVQAALDKFMQNRTTIAIAHRLSTIKKADHIYVLRDGKVVEQGTHDSLIAENGEYYRFVQLQELQ